MTRARSRERVLIGVDTHKHLHVAVAIDALGVKLGTLTISADSAGYVALEGWAAGIDRRAVFGVEGTGSYGAGLASFLRRSGYRVVEVNRGDRRTRRANGKSDTIDAELAARAVLSGEARTIPKSADGASEMLRQVKIARDTAVKSRTQAIVALKCIIVNTPAELRESLTGLADKRLIDTCAALRPGPVETPLAAAKHALRTIARRWLSLAREITQHDAILDALTLHASPTLRDGFGIGPDTAAEVLIVFGDNPERVHSEAAFAKLAGAAPIPASSGKTTRHRLSWGGHRQLNAALYRTTIVRMRHHQPTRAYVARRTAEGLSKREIIRCLKRYLAREIYHRVHTDATQRKAIP